VLLAVLFKSTENAAGVFAVGDVDYKYEIAGPEIALGLKPFGFSKRSAAIVRRQIQINFLAFVYIRLSSFERRQQAGSNVKDGYFQI